MNTAREEILNRIRGALAADPSPPEPIPRDYRLTSDPGMRSAQFVARAAAYRATVRWSGPGRGVARTVAQICAEHDLRRVVVPPGLPSAWRPSAIAVVEDEPFDAEQLDGFDGVLTGCTLAIAETGTIVLAGGPRDGRRALTLIPDVHLCVVEEGQIVGLVPEAIAALAGSTAPVTLISGPSATSDIEFQRVEGVHGPRTLEIIVVTGAAPRRGPSPAVSAGP